MTIDTTLALPADAVDPDGNDIFESSRGVRFLSSPEAKFANVPAPTPEEIERDFRNVTPKPDARVFVLRTMQARQLWLGRLPPTRPGDGVRIPGVPFAHFILTGLLRRRAAGLDIYLDNLARHADTVVRAINVWRRRNDRWVQRTIPDGAKPLSDPATTARFFLETRHTPLTRPPATPLPLFQPPIHTPPTCTPPQPLAHCRVPHSTTTHETALCRAPTAATRIAAAPTTKNDV